MDYLEKMIPTPIWASLALEMDWEGRIWSLGLRREEELVERVRRREKTE